LSRYWARSLRALSLVSAFMGSQCLLALEYSECQSAIIN